MSDSFAERCAAAVAAVEHSEKCQSRFGLGASHPHLAAYIGACDCDRDARIGRGLVAALVYMNEDEPTERHERAALAAFAEAAK